MKKINIYYRIVPIKNGCVYLGINKNTGETYLCDKALIKRDDSLIFSSESAAKEWMLLNLSADDFKVEWLATTDIIEGLSDIKKDSLTELNYYFEVGM